MPELQAPQISVVITVFNRPAYLRDALRSVLQQDCDEAVEILVIDDGSDVPVEPQFAREFPSVRWIRQANGGMCAARQRGVDLARGEFIAFLDDDDAWHPTKLRLQMNVMRARPDLAGVGSDLTDLEEVAGEPVGFFRQQGFVTAARAQPIPGLDGGYTFRLSDMVDFMLRVLPMMPSSLMFTKTALREAGGWDPAVKTCGEIQDLLFRLMRSRLIGYVDRPLLGLRRTHTDHMTHDRFGQLYLQARVICSAYDRYPADLRTVLKRPMLDMLNRMASKLNANGHPSKAARLVLAAIRRGSVRPRTLFNATRYAARSLTGGTRKA